MEEQAEILKLHRTQSEKFIYYLVALAVTSIGFSVYKTTGQALKITQIPLGLAIICWGLSIYFGLINLKYSIATLRINYAYFNIMSGNDSDVGNNPQKINAAKKIMENIFEESSGKANKYAKWQEKLFYFGIVLFLVWHVIEMYVLSI